MTAFVIPSGLRESARAEGREEWLLRLPAMVAEICASWHIDAGDPFVPGGQTAWVAPVHRHTDECADLVLKVCWPHPEALHEADGLRAWEGNGAVRLHRAEQRDDATVLLLERCRPGTQLRAQPADEHDVVVARLLRRLWIDPPSGIALRPLHEMCDYWADRYEERDDSQNAGLDEDLWREGIRLLRALPRSAEREVVLHTDLHAGNVLAAQREPWLAIDPKPYVGDPTYDATQHVFNGVFVEGLGIRPLASRMAVLLDLDLDRLLRWLFARAVEASPYWSGMAELARTLAPD